MHIRNQRLPLYASVLVLVFLGWLPGGLTAQSGDQVIQRVREGIELHDAGKYQEALAVYQGLLDATKGQEELLWYEMGYTYYAMGKYDLCIHFMDKVLKHKGKEHTESAFMVKASALEHQGKAKQAMATFRSAIQDFPSSHLLHYNLAITLSRTGGTEEAIRMAEQAVHLDMSHLKSHQLLSELQERRGDFVSALLPLYWTLFKDPDSREAGPRLKRLLNLLTLASGEMPSPNSNKNATATWAPLLKALQDSKTPSPGSGTLAPEIFLQKTLLLANTAREFRPELPAFYTKNYLDRLVVLNTEELLPAFCELLRLSELDDAEAWISEHEEALERIMILMD